MQWLPSSWFGKIQRRFDCLERSSARSINSCPCIPCCLRIPSCHWQYIHRISPDQRSSLHSLPCVNIYALSNGGRLWPGLLHGNTLMVLEIWRSAFIGGSRTGDQWGDREKGSEGGLREDGVMVLLAMAMKNKKSHLELRMSSYAIRQHAEQLG
mmetsp:Transcript_43426/g.64388  ORF Transcript_43426/g.64388 Transcript_43426/m.64388 type:complete len:154 (+) Transcript_43426:286-747(+)